MPRKRHWILFRFHARYSIQGATVFLLYREILPLMFSDGRAFPHIQLISWILSRYISSVRQVMNVRGVESAVLIRRVRGIRLHCTKYLQNNWESMQSVGCLRWRCRLRRRQSRELVRAQPWIQFQVRRPASSQITSTAGRETSTGVSAQPGAGKSAGNMSTGEMAAIVVGAAALLVIGAVLGIFWRRKFLERNSLSGRVKHAAVQ